MITMDFVIVKRRDVLIVIVILKVQLIIQLIVTQKRVNVIVSIRERVVDAPIVS
jgi:hypothetical protein